MFDIIKRHLADFSSSNWPAFQAGLAHDVIFSELPTSRRTSGAAGCVQFVQQWKRAFPDLAATVVSGFVSGDKVVAEVEWEGTHKGPLEGPFGKVAATNNPVVVNACLVFTLKHGKITESRHYFDLLTLLGQLGAVPMIAAPAQTPSRPGKSATPRH